MITIPFGSTAIVGARFERWALRYHGWSIAWVALCLVAVGCERRLATPATPRHERVEEIRAALTAAGGAGAAEKDTASAVAEPTGWGTLKGTVRMAGTAPAPEALRIDKEVEICAPGGKTVYSDALVVGSTGGIKNVAIYLLTKTPDDPKWIHESAKPGKSDDVVFDQRNCVFLSHLLVMQSTQKLKIINSDPTGHNTKLSPAKNPSFDQTVPQGGSVVYQPTSEEAAPFPVACAIHPWMSAWIMTRNNGYFAVTNEQGEFEIPNVPAGVELEFRIWHERAPSLASATVNGTPKQKLSKGRLRLTLDSQDASKNQRDLEFDSSQFKK